MAEVVNKHLQSMTDEIEEMRRLSLFTNNELGVIIKSRRDFEYKINGVHRNLSDFKDYILHEKVLLKQIHLRRDKKKVSDRKGGIEYKIIKRIKNLYEIAMHRFPTEFSLYEQYFNFCKQSNYNSGAANVVQNMLKNFSFNEKVWQVASHWHAYDQKNVNFAKKIIYKGLSLHKNSRILYNEAFQLVLSGPDGESDTQKIEALNIYIGLIIKDMKDADYLVEILSLLEKYPFTEKIQNRIIEELLKNYSHKEFVWHTLAEREMNGFHYDEVTKESADPLFACFEVYRTGLTKLEGEEKAIFYAKYLDKLITTQRERSDEPKWKDALQAALQQASNEKFLSEKYYITWIELCASDDKAQEILNKGTSDLPHSLDLWKLRLRYATMGEKNAYVDKVFKEGRSALKDKSLPLWLMYIRYYSLLSRDDKVEDAYKAGVEEDEEISQKLKPRYLEFLALHKGIKETRAAYKVLAHKRPYCKELHSTMSKLESAEMTYDLEVWSQVHELACKQFGDDDVDVWINHIMFYLQFNNKAPKFQQIIRSIYSNAENMLNPLLLPDFIEKYTLESAKLQ